MPANAASTSPTIDPLAVVCWPMARFAIAGTLVATLLFPADSTAVELGSATYLSLLTLPAAIAAFLVWPLGPSRGRTIEWLLLILVAWVGLATWSVAGRGNVRFAMNEFWIWLAALAIFAAARRTITTTAQKQCLTVLLLSSLSTLAVHTLHQKFISIPESIRQYRLDPDAQIRLAGLDAPAGSAIRFQYEGRLFAAESMASFSLSTSAAVALLLGFSIAAALVTWRRQLQLSRWQATAAAIATALFAVGIYCTGSRIVLVLLCGVAALLLLSRLGGQTIAKFEPLKNWGQRHAAAIAVGIGLGGTLTGAAIAQFPQLLARFPLSVQFRFQYWSSSLRMLADHLWLGIGPGNFQAGYPRYKAASMSEMIADPHNFILETATAAGLPAGLLCLAIVAALAAAWSRSGRGQRETEDSASDPPSTGFDWAICGGAAAAAVGVWFLGPWFGGAPDLEPYLISIPLASALVYLYSSWFGSDACWEPVAWLGCFAVLAALLFSGGWTTPGIVIPLWCLIGTLTSTPRTEPGDDRNGRYLSLLIGLALFALFSTTTLTPITQSMALTRQATDRLARGDTSTGTQAIEQAAAADRWDPEPVRHLASLQTRALMQQHDAAARQAWQQTLADAIARDPNNPRAWQQLADAQLRVYHRWGDRDDLQDARQATENALQMDPTSIQITAQVAVLAAATGDNAAAATAWQRVHELSEVNKNTESDWDLLSILPATRAENGFAPLESITIAEAWANRKADEAVEND